MLPDGRNSINLDIITRIRMLNDCLAIEITTFYETLNISFESTEDRDYLWAKINKKIKATW
jgi:hypothetical protein